MAHRLDLARPVVCAATGLHPDQARRKIREEHSHLVSAQLLLYEHLGALVDCVDLKHVLGQVNANSRNLHGERSFSVQVVDQRLHFGTSVRLRVGAFIPLLTQHQRGIDFIIRCDSTCGWAVARDLLRSQLNLGSHFDLPQDQWAALSARIDGLVRGQGGLVESTLSDAGQVLAQRYATLRS
jgi:hypothetical protein